MYCRKCGRELKEESRFCPKCGTSIKIEKKNNNVYKLAPILVLIIVIILLVVGIKSCGNKEEVEIEPKINTTKELSEITTDTDNKEHVIEDTINLEDMVKAYEDYLKTVNGYEGGVYYLFYLNNDEIPELVIDTYNENQGALFLSYIDERVNAVELEMGIIEYIERQDLLKLTTYCGSLEKTIIYDYCSSGLEEQHVGILYRDGLGMGSYDLDNEDMVFEENYRGALETCFNSELAKSIYDLPIAGDVQEAYKVLQDGIKSDSVINKKTIETFIEYYHGGQSINRGLHICVNGNKLRTLYYNNQNVNTQYEITSSCDYKYDEKGYLIEKVSDTMVVKHENDENGLLLKEIINITLDDGVHVYEYDYNSSGHIVKYTYSHPTETEYNTTNTYEYEYMRNGLLESTDPTGMLLINNEKETEIYSISDLEFVIPYFMNTQMYIDTIE